MKNKTNHRANPEGSVLHLAHVRVDGATNARPRLDALSFQLSAGKAVRIVLRDGMETGRLLANLASGLRDPDQGEVLCFGKRWRNASPSEAARRRARIGRVFSGTAWISNLDMDENLLLAARQHDIAPDSLLFDQAQQLARRFGLETIPSGRPAWISPSILHRMQWIRALLGRPNLLLLENPTFHSDSSLIEKLIGAVTEAQARGAATVWLIPPEAAKSPIPAEQEYLVEDGRFLPGVSVAIPHQEENPP